MRAALVNDLGKIENIIELADNYDPQAKDAYFPPPGYTLIIDKERKAIIGGMFKDGIWTAPVIPDIPPQPSLQEQIDILVALLVKKGTLTSAQALEIKGPKK